MNSSEEKVGGNGIVKWPLTVIGLLIIPGALWLASFLISYPKESVAFARKYGGLIWVALALVSAIWFRAQKRKKGPTASSEIGD
jgi:FtsH-binding integral membrane protein